MSSEQQMRSLVLAGLGRRCTHGATDPDTGKCTICVELADSVVAELREQIELGDADRRAEVERLTVLRVESELGRIVARRIVALCDGSLDGTVSVKDLRAALNSTPDTQFQTQVAASENLRQRIQAIVAAARATQENLYRHRDETDRDRTVRVRRVYEERANELGGLLRQLDQALVATKDTR